MFDLGHETEALAKRVIGAGIEVHRALGPGYLEKTYQSAMSVELHHLGIEHVIEQPVQVLYRGVSVGEGRLDIVFPGFFLIELKTVDVLADVHRAQVIAYLKATGLKLGYLMNFKTAVLREGIQRIVYS
ncbi:MAG: GxxExxY protein [Phycisphaerales bacterium JB063]